MPPLDDFLATLRAEHAARAERGWITAGEQVVGWAGKDMAPSMSWHTIPAASYIGSSARAEIKAFTGRAGRQASFAIVHECEYTKTDYDNGESPILAFVGAHGRDIGGASAAEAVENPAFGSYAVYPGRIIPGPFDGIRFRRNSNPNTPSKDIVVAVVYNMPLPTDLIGEAAIQQQQTETLVGYTKSTLTTCAITSVALNGTTAVALLAAGSLGTALKRRVHLSGKIHATADIYISAAAAPVIGTDAYLVSPLNAAGGYWEKILETNSALYAICSAACANPVTIIEET